MSDSGRFIGEGREDLVELLLAEWALVRDGGRSRMVTLLGPSGVGKTRVVQEFYERIAADQETWPKSLVADKGNIREERKVIRLPSTISKGPGMPWLWLGMDCDPGPDLNGIGEITPWLQECVPSAFQDGLMDVADPKGLAKEVGFQAVEVVAGATGVGLVASVAVRAYQTVKARQEAQEVSAGEKADRTINLASRSVSSVLTSLAASTPTNSIASTPPDLRADRTSFLLGPRGSRVSKLMTVPQPYSPKPSSR